MGSINSFSGVNEQQLIVTPANPGAGANLSYTVPSGGYAALQLEAMHMLLTTDATVSNRLLRFRVTRSSNILGFWAAPAVTAASTSLTISFTKIGAINTQSTTSTVALLPLIFPPLLPGDILTSFVLNLQSGDTLTNIVLTFTAV